MINSTYLNKRGADFLAPFLFNLNVQFNQIAELFYATLSILLNPSVMLAGLIADFIVHFAAIADKQPKLKYLKLGDNYYFVNGNSFKGIIPQGAWTYSS